MSMPSAGGASVGCGIVVVVLAFAALVVVVVPLAYSMVVGYLDRVSGRMKLRREAKDAEKRAARRAALERDNEGAAQPVGD